MNEEVCESFTTLSGSFTRQGSQVRNLLRPLYPSPLNLRTFSSSRSAFRIAVFGRMQQKGSKLGVRSVGICVFGAWRERLQLRVHFNCVTQIFDDQVPINSGRDPDIAVPHEA